MGKANKTKKNSSFFILQFAPLGVLITLLSALIFLAVQQTIRLTHNDQLVQLSQAVVDNLSTQSELPTSFPAQKVNIANNISSFFMIYDKNKKLIGSTAILDNKVPEIPSGVLDYAKANSENRVTWQPRKGVRIGLVVKYFKGKTEGYVAAGKSLVEVEKREDLLQTQIGIGWIVTMITTFMVNLFIQRIKSS